MNSKFRTWVASHSVTVLLGLALSASVATTLRGWQQLQQVTSANETVRKSLGDLTVALAEKDREIGRLSGSPCKAAAR